MLDQDIRLLDLLKLKNKAKLHLCWKQSIKKVLCLNIPDVFKYPKTFQCDNGSEFKNKVKKLLEKHNVDIRRGTTKYRHTHSAFVTKSWQNCCLNKWMLKSFKTLKKYLQFELKN